TTRHPSRAATVRESAVLAGEVTAPRLISVHETKWNAPGVVVHSTSFHAPYLTVDKGRDG
ncbi:MAG: hypothetical protein KDA52_23940, partial [Planctomycetaceae bacterium]|nr:hypothetical protein [Planctomycetaceae bacterium]